MNETIPITLNGQPIRVAAGATIREAALTRGVAVPTFCHDDRLQPFASCQLCVVEVEKTPELLPACATRVTPEMAIHTDSPRVIDSRREAVARLLADHVGDCIAPCESTCPAHIDVQGTIAHLANGQVAAALRLIKQQNPLPAICGYVCPHPCESQCRRALVDEPVAIRALLRSVADHELAREAPVATPGPDTGYRVAIVGGGPAGLSAAYYLRLAGHEVEIFEALPELGGMARYGIPRFRLPRERVEQEIQAILAMGVVVHANQRLGRDFTVAELRERGFGAVLLAIGAHRTPPMGLAGEETPGIIGGVDFLRQVVLGQTFGLTGRRVAVIGGEITALDCARVARRLGAEVLLLHREPQAAMTAWPTEQEETHEEGVAWRFLTAPVGVVVVDGQTKGLRVVTMDQGEPDRSGQRHPVPQPGSEEELPCDLIVVACGREPDLTALQNEPPSTRPDTTPLGTLACDEKTQATSVPGVFAAGDCASGPDLLIRAIQQGRRSARAIDLHLTGAKIQWNAPYAMSLGRWQDLEGADWISRHPRKPRAREIALPPDQRLSNQQGYALVNPGLDQAQAMDEAGRCLGCGCSARFDCVLRHHATAFGTTAPGDAARLRECPPDGRHPLIRIEAGKCIACAACVRACAEVRQIHALTLTPQGGANRVAPAAGKSLPETGCDGCGLCSEVCPTGALTPNTGQECGPWSGSEAWTTSCTHCSRGCGLRVVAHEGRVVEVRGLPQDPVNDGILCAEGRFSYRLPGAGESDPAVAAAAFRTAREILFQAKRVAVVVSPWITVEEIYAAARLARVTGGTLHYARGESAGDPARPHGRMAGEANLALLSRLQAEPWRDGSIPDCLVLVEAVVNPPAGAQVVVVGVLPVVGMEVAVWLPIADALHHAGALLNREGSLAWLQPIPLDTDRLIGYQALVSLAGEERLGALEELRRQLVAEIPELAALEDEESGQRVVATTLAPELAAVALDNRQLHFARFMGGLGLPW